MRAILKPLSLATSIGMLVVVVMGATVTNTGSAEGCGRSWPLCNGQLIPEFAVKTMIELSHRAVTGIETVLVLTLAAGLLIVYRQRGPEGAPARVLAILMVGGLFLQAGMGAWAVLYPQQPGVIALHFGISLIAFASTVLAATFVREADSGQSRRGVPVPPSFVRLVWLSLIYSLPVVYLGAYIRHAGFDAACRDWPLCNGAIVPTLSLPVVVVLAHRLAALGLVGLLIILAVWAGRLRAERPDLANGSLAALALVLLQSLSGATVVWTGLGLWSALSHAGIMALLFGSISYLCFQVRPLAESARTAQDEGGGSTRVQPSKWSKSVSQL